MLSLLETCRFRLDGGAMFGVVPKNLWQRAYPYVDEQNRIDMAARSLLIRTDDAEGKERIVVVDAGCGHKLAEKLEKIYALDHSRYTLADSLAEAGVAPEEVTDFIYTHLHFDHAGGSTVLDASGNPVPLFPNARHYVQERQLEWARNPTDKDRASFMPENWEPVAEAGLLEILDGTTDVLPGIELRPFDGHTAGMQLVIVHGERTVEPVASGASDASSSNDSTDEPLTLDALVYMADLVPTSAHISLPYIMGYDNEPLVTLEEKKSFLPEIFERNWGLVFEHDAHAEGRTIREGKRGLEGGGGFVVGGL